MGDIGWQLVAQLARNHVALGDDGQANAASLRELLLLHGPTGDAGWTHQVEGLRTLQARQAVRRLPFKGPMSFGSGVELELQVDEQAFQGGSAFLLASAVEHCFARHAAINSFVQLTLSSLQRGPIKRWPPRPGARAMA